MSPLKKSRIAGERQRPLLSMPPGEVFAAWVLADAVSRHLDTRLQAVVAVGDCAPSARAISCR